jgi:hypothetical protein
MHESVLITLSAEYLRVDCRLEAWKKKWGRGRGHKIAYKYCSWDMLPIWGLSVPLNLLSERSLIKQLVEMAEFGFLLALTALSFAALAWEYLLGWYPLIDFPIKFWRCIIRRHLTSTNVTYNASIELSCDKLFGIDPDSCVLDTSLWC